MQSKISCLLSNKKTQKWIFWGIVCIVAFQLYFVREMLAALLLFTAVFLFIATIVLAVYLLDEGSRLSVEWTVSGSKTFSHFAHQTWMRIEEVTRKQLNRIRSAPAR